MGRTQSLNPNQQAIPQGNAPPGAPTGPPADMDAYRGHDRGRGRGWLGVEEGDGDGSKSEPRICLNFASKQAFGLGSS